MTIKQNYIFKKAYTLAEILIVMGILSIVMTLLIRNIVRVDPDKDKVLFIKTYQAVEEIIANSINDASKYDQNIYTKTELENWEGDMHFNLEHAPLDTAYIKYINAGKKETACKNNCDKKLTQKNAPCYYVAEYINTIGPVNCSGDSANTLNLRSSIGVCFWDWSAKISTNKQYFEAIIDPSCVRNDDNKLGYAVRIYRSGAMEIPEKSDLVIEKNQKKAFEWMKSPTTID